MRGWILGMVAATCACGKGEPVKTVASPDATPVKTPDGKVVAVATPDATPKPDVKALAVELNEAWTKAKDACAGGDGDACRKLGSALTRGKDSAPKDGAAARIVLVHGCDVLNHPGSCITMASAAEEGELGRKDPVLGAKYWSRACDVGGGATCHNYAVILLEGEQGVPPDVERAQTLLESACDAGRSESCAVLSRQLTLEKLKVRNGRTSEWFLKRACDLGMPELCAKP